MKRIFSAILVFCLFYSTAALAADKPHTDTDILFRDIPWEVSINDVKAALTDDGLPEGLFTGGITVNDVDGRYSTDNAGIMYAIRKYALDDIGGFFVAGHRVSEITANAIYGITDGFISKTAADSKFYNATYYFELPEEKEEQMAIFDDLQQKMTVIYGEPGVVDGNNRISRVAWYGQEYHTMVLMYYYKSVMPQLYIEYWNNMVVPDIKALQEIMYTGDLSSSDGL